MRNQEMKIDTIKLKKLRQAKGWTQQHLADVSGISLRTIQRAELKGSVSTETINALSAVFELNHLDWSQPDEPEINRAQIISKGWKIALIVIALTQLTLVTVIWMLVGNINLIWIKVMVISWFLLGLITFVIWITMRSHKLKSLAEITRLNQKVQQRER